MDFFLKRILEKFVVVLSRVVENIKSFSHVVQLQAWNIWREVCNEWNPNYVFITARKEVSPKMSGQQIGHESTSDQMKKRNGSLMSIFNWYYRYTYELINQFSVPCCYILWARFLIFIGLFYAWINYILAKLLFSWRFDPLVSLGLAESLFLIYILRLASLCACNKSRKISLFWSRQRTRNWDCFYRWS